MQEGGKWGIILDTQFSGLNCVESVCAEHTGEGLGEDNKFSFPRITHACISFKH